MRQSERGALGAGRPPLPWGLGRSSVPWGVEGTGDGPWASPRRASSIGRLTLSSSCQLPARTRGSADQAFPTGMKTQQDHTPSFPSRPWFFVASIETHMGARWWSLHKLIVCHVSPRLSFCVCD